MRNKKWYRSNFELSSYVIGNSNDETNVLHKLLITDTQVSGIQKAFEKVSSANMKLLKTQLSKMIQSVRFLELIDKMLVPAMEFKLDFLGIIDSIDKIKCLEKSL